MSSQRLKDQAGSLHGSVPDPLHMDDSMVFWGLLTVVVGISLTLCLLLGWFSSYTVVLSSLVMRAFVIPYCILVCSVWILSLGSLLFSQKEKVGK